MNQLQTKGIILGRTEFGEADRIITLLTPEQGKLRLMAKGVRKIKSKLAGGIELFSVSDITFIRGRGDIGTLISARLDQHYGNIVQSIDRVQLGYELIKSLDKATEDEPEAEYFDLLLESFQALNDPSLEMALVRIWFQAHLLKFAGHTPNLHTDTTGNKLVADQLYNFDYEAMTFTPHSAGRFSTDHIKLLRLTFAGNSLKNLRQINGLDKLLLSVGPVLQAMVNSHIRV